MTADRANYLLRHFPALWRGANSATDYALEGGYHGDMTGTGRHSQGAISDNTGNRAVALAEAKGALKELKTVQLWINLQLPEPDRPFLISVWRYGVFGWHWVARDLGLEVAGCKRRWDNLVHGLVNWTQR